MLRPVYWSEQNNAGALHEERAQIAIATLGDAAEDGTITAGGSSTEQLPTISNEASTSSVSIFGAIIRIWPRSKILNVQFCSD